MPATRHKTSGADPRAMFFAAAMVLLGSLSFVVHGLAVLRDQSMAGNLFGIGLWQRVVAALGGTVAQQGDHWEARLDSGGPLAVVVSFGFAAWLIGGMCIARHHPMAFGRALVRWGLIGWSWWLLSVVWEAIDVAVSIAGWNDGLSLLRGMLPLWHGLMWAGWLTTGCALARRPSVSLRTENAGARIPHVVWGAMGVYFLVFSAMNIGLYASLQLPHGDSAMYEEHLWNLLHGKGFRSYLDDGRLFLGEHIQVIHVLLVPIYLLWPSQITLELCQSAALAAAAIPLYRIAVRHSGSTRAATALAIAYLLYVPMQFLDIAVDLKTFRPNSFEIPLFLVAFDALEGKRWRTFFIALFLALLCQEDAATIIAPLGVWVWSNARSLGGMWKTESDVRNDAMRVRTPNSALRTLGIGLALFGTMYVVLVIKVILPWFRGGGDVHFAQYYGELGSSSGSIVLNVLSHPLVVLGRLTSVESIGFGLALLAPLGFLSLLSPGRLAVAAPLFGVLCLSDITNSIRHHFHAPLVPVLLWAAAAGLANVSRVQNWLGRWWKRPETSSTEKKQRIGPEQIVASGKSLPAVTGHRLQAGSAMDMPRPDPVAVESVAVWCALGSFCTGVFLGLSPLSLSFWDPDSHAYWKTIYIPGERAQNFAVVLPQIPENSRVASTDFVHPRFTHFERSYDYSAYRPNVPDDAEYIVIDTRHGYSDIRRPEEVKEYHDHPETWELLPDRTDGYFIILRRIRGK